MTFTRIKQLAQQAGGFRKFLRTPVTVDSARIDIRRRLEQRESNFIELAKQLIYDVPSSPYRRLLLWARCEHGDLRSSVQTRGLEKTLEKLRDEGVYLTLEEFKSVVPISRGGLSFETHETDFDNPFLLGGRISGNTSGSRGRTSKVNYDWDFITEEASHEILLYAIHEVLDAPLALWFPVPPGVAGLHNLLMSLKIGKAPERWFSQSSCGILATSLEARLALEFVIWGGRSAGVTVPRPSFADLSCADEVARWIEAALKKRGRVALRTFGSSAIRLAQTALAIGADLHSGVIFAGGEPLTEPRRRFLESAGMTVYPRYVTTESGLVAAACPNRSVTDDMHFYSDRLAVVQLQRGVTLAPEQIQNLLFTALTLHTGKVMLNTEMGDFGEITTRSCDCTFGELGLNVHLSGVRSYEKLTLEGMTVLTAELDSLIGAEIEKVGGRPDSYQFREAQGPDGLNRLIIAVSPEVALDENRFIENILGQLRRGGPRKAMAAEFWGKAASLQVVREEPKSSAGHKVQPLMRPRRAG